MHLLITGLHNHANLIRAVDFFITAVAKHLVHLVARTLRVKEIISLVTLISITRVVQMRCQAHLLNIVEGGLPHQFDFSFPHFVKLQFIFRCAPTSAHNIKLPLERYRSHARNHSLRTSQHTNRIIPRGQNFVIGEVAVVD